MKTPKLAMRLLAPLALLAVSVNANAYLIGLDDGNALERAALVGTLEAMGHTVTTTIDGSLDLIISAPGNETDDFPGIPYLQISDWGQDHLDNDFADFPGDTVVSITLAGDHPILDGLDASWDTWGFWRYDHATEYIGWVTGIEGLADGFVDGGDYPNMLAATDSDIYIGWNVYGPDATANDLLLLENSIEFLARGVSTVPVPVMGMPGMVLMLLLFGVAAIAFRGRMSAA